MIYIQNVACLEIKANPQDSKILFNKDILRNKKINAIYNYASMEDFVALNPSGNQSVIISEDLRNGSFFLNVFNINDKKIIEDFNLENIQLKSNTDKFYEYSINQIIDFDKSYLTPKIPDFNNTLNLLLYVFYQSEQKISVNDQLNGSISIPIICNPTQEI